MSAKTVLVVEDSADHRFIAIHSLERGGFIAVGVANGSEALDFLRVHPAPDAILLDLNMPQMNGWDFLDQQRKDPAIANVPVVIFSSAIDSGFRSKVPPNVVAWADKLAGSSWLVQAVAMACSYSDQCY